MRKLIHIAPLLMFVVLVLALFSFLQRDVDQLNSVLIDKNFPQFSLTKLENEDVVLTKNDISDFPAIVNVWATSLCRKEKRAKTRTTNISRGAICISFLISLSSNI
jgi:hypothetical protein